VAAIPGGVYRYAREGRMLWPLAVAIVLGTLPGVLLGTIIRIQYLPDPGRFKLFAGAPLMGTFVTSIVMDTCFLHALCRRWLRAGQSITNRRISRSPAACAPVVYCLSSCVVITTESACCSG
jgi:uncharacterized membrane protein YfcA